jgi:hypothetical protein
MRWNTGKQIWMMYHYPTRFFLQEFFDCKNVQKYFMNPEREQDNLYTITLNKED